MTVHQPPFDHGTQTLPSLDRVHAELVEVIRDLVREGRSTRSAGIKPRLAARLGGSFDEKRYGFSTFREFLHAVQEAGLVELRAASSGPDLEVALPGQPVEPPPKIAPAQIRPDLWSAFMDWTPGLERVYDRNLRCAFRVSAAAGQHDEQTQRLLRQIRADADRFVLIEPIGMATQLEWARDFTAARPPGPERDLLAQALETERPLQEFTRQIRASDASLEWQIFRNTRVAQHIRAWARRHDLAVEPMQGVRPDEAAPSPAPPPAASKAPAADRRPEAGSRPSGAEVDLATLREHAHRLIDRMTLEELLALPLTLGMLYRR